MPLARQDATDLVVDVVVESWPEGPQQLLLCHCVLTRRQSHCVRHECLSKLSTETSGEERPSLGLGHSGLREVREAEVALYTLAEVDPNQIANLAQPILGEARQLGGGPRLHREVAERQVEGKVSVP